MKKLIILLTLFYSVGLIAGCEKDKASEDAGNVSAELNQCSKDEGGVYICLDSLIVDNRCPEGAECFWSGDAIVRVIFHENENTHQFDMSLLGTFFYNLPKDTVINHFKVTFKGLLPAPSVNPPKNPQKTIAFFTIAR